MTEGKKIPTSSVKEVVMSANTYGCRVDAGWPKWEELRELFSTTSPLLRYALQMFSDQEEEEEKKERGQHMCRVSSAAAVTLKDRDDV